MLAGKPMSTFQTIFSAFAAMVMAFFVIVAPTTNNSKATGIAVIPAILLFSWQFWLLAVFCFLLFFASSRIGNKVLKGLLFWAPVMAISVLGLSFIALVIYSLVWMHFRKS